MGRRMYDVTVRRDGSSVEEYTTDLDLDDTTTVRPHLVAAIRRHRRGREDVTDYTLDITDRAASQHVMTYRIAEEE